MAGKQKHYDSSTIRSFADFFKISMMNVATNIIITASDPMKENSTTALFAWGAGIETWDAFIGIYYKNDSDYQTKIKKFKADLDNCNPYEKRMEDKLKIKRIYDEWFSLICTKLARFKIFPPLPVGYAQGIGEVQAKEGEM